MPSRLKSYQLSNLEDFISPEPMSGCWIWTRAVSGGGYAMLRAWEPGKGSVTVYVHRVMFERFVGHIPKGYQVDHLCKVRCCVNPRHLEAVTVKENHLRSGRVAAFKKMKAAQTHCINGHQFNEQNTYRWKTHRSCRACHKDRERRRRYAIIA